MRYNSHEPNMYTVRLECNNSRRERGYANYGVAVDELD